MPETIRDLTVLTPTEICDDTILTPPQRLAALQYIADGFTHHDWDNLWPADQPTTPALVTPPYTLTQQQQFAKVTAYPPNPKFTNAIQVFAPCRLPETDIHHLFYLASHTATVLASGEIIPNRPHQPAVANPGLD